MGIKERKKINIFKNKKFLAVFSVFVLCIVVTAGALTFTLGGGGQETVHAANTQKTCAASGCTRGRCNQPHTNVNCGTNCRRVSCGTNCVGTNCSRCHSTHTSRCNSGKAHCTAQVCPACGAEGETRNSSCPLTTGGSLVAPCGPSTRANCSTTRFTCNHGTVCPTGCTRGPSSSCPTSCTRGPVHTYWSACHGQHPAACLGTCTINCPTGCDWLWNCGHRDRGDTNGQLHWWHTITRTDNTGIGNTTISFSNLSGRQIQPNDFMRGSSVTATIRPAAENRRFPNNGANVRVAQGSGRIEFNSSREVRIRVDSIQAFVVIEANTEWRTYTLEVSSEHQVAGDNSGSVSVNITGAAGTPGLGTFGLGTHTITWGQNVSITATPRLVGFRVHQIAPWDVQGIHSNPVTHSFTVTGPPASVIARFRRHTSAWTPTQDIRVPNGIGGTPYSRQLDPPASGIDQDFTYTLAHGSNALHGGLTLASNGLLHTPTGVNLTHVSVDTDRTFTVRATSSNGNFIDREFTMRIIPMTYPVNYHQGTNPPGGIVQGAQITQSIKTWGQPMDLRTDRYTVRCAVSNNPVHNNWEQVGWTTGPTEWLTHRNFASTGAPGMNPFVPNPSGNPRTFGAGTVVLDVNLQPVTWSVPQRQLPSNFNPDPPAHAPINLNPIWAPVRTELRYILGTQPPNSGTVTPSSPLTIGLNTSAGGIRLTNQPFTFPSATVGVTSSFGNVYTVSGGAIWQQIGWTLETSPKFLRPHATLPDQASATNPGGMDFAPGQVFQSNHPLFATYWEPVREIRPVWRRVITHGNVNIAFVGGPDGFMEESLGMLGIAASMPFRVATNGITINHASPTAEHPNDTSPFSGQLTLPTFNQMSELGLAQDPSLVFEGWFLRTSWDPDEVVQLTATNAGGRYTLPSTLCASCPTPVVCPCGIWPQGIFDSIWEPYIWIEARWA